MPTLDLEERLFNFEQAWANNGDADPADFLPPDSDSGYLDILTELVRCDMEFRFDRGTFPSSQQYFSRFPELSGNKRAKTSVVYEEYRLCNSNDRPVSATELGSVYGVDCSGWPEVSSFQKASEGPQTSVRFPVVGEAFLDFELVGVLGQGAFGKVLLARQDDLASRLVVLKFTSARTDEHKLLARMQHTNIMPVHSVHRHGDLLAICMPLLGVSTLRDILRQCQSGSDRREVKSNALVSTVNRARANTVASTIETDDNLRRFRSLRKSDSTTQENPRLSLAAFATEIMIQICDGLAYAHSHGIIHGDLKPANILIDDDGRPVILDFHLARNLSGDTQQMAGGTLPYMAPEQLRLMDANSVSATPQSDIYASGVILYELISGRLPFNSDIADPLAVLADEKERSLSISDDFKRTAGEDICAIITKCLAPDPADRFCNGEQLADELRRAADYQPLLVSPNGSLRNRLTKWSRRHPRLTSATTVLAFCSIAIALIAGAFFYTRDRVKNLEAINNSITRIERANPVSSSTATLFWNQDQADQQRVVEAARELIEENRWGSIENFGGNEARRLGRLHADSEKLAAARLHFWIASALHDQAGPGRSETLISEAIGHNEMARALWPASSTSYCLDLQKKLLDGEWTASGDVPAEIYGEIDNSVDRMLCAFLYSSDAPSAEKLFDAIVAGNPEDIQSWLVLGNVCASLEKYEKALACYAVYGSFDQDSHLPRMFSGMARLKLNEPRLAKEDLRLAAQKSPDNVTIRLNLALAHIRLQEFNLALRELDRAIELGATETRAWYLRSRVRRRLNDLSGAEDDMRTFFEAVPVDEISCITLANQKMNDDPQAAIRDLELALKFNPGSRIAHNNLAHIYSEILDDNDTAIEHMDKAIEVTPDDPALLAARGVLLARIGERDKAIADAGNAMRIDSGADTMYLVAGIFAQTSEIEPADKGTAVSLLAKAALADPRTVMRRLADDPDIEAIKDHSIFRLVIDSIEGLVRARDESVERN